MKKCSVLFILFMMNSTVLLLAQAPPPNSVHLNNIAKKPGGKFYHTDNLSKPFSGEAYALHPGTGKMNLYYKIVNGETAQFIIYSASGSILTEANYSSGGTYSGKYFLANEKGDTLSSGIYHNGIKTGCWVETDSTAVKKIIVY